MVHETIKTGSKAMIQDSTMVSMDTGSLMYGIQDPGNLHLLLATLLLSIYRGVHPMDRYRILDQDNGYIGS